VKDFTTAAESLIDVPASKQQTCPDRAADRDPANEGRPDEQP
jgi:hypothetical protein